MTLRNWRQSDRKCLSQCSCLSRLITKTGALYDQQLCFVRTIVFACVWLFLGCPSAPLSPKDCSVLVLCSSNSMERTPSLEASSRSAIEGVPPILWNPEVNHRGHKSPALDAILRQMNIAHTLPLYFFKIRFNIILPSRPRSSFPCFAFTLFRSFHGLWDAPPTHQKRGGGGSWTYVLQKSCPLSSAAPQASGHVGLRSITVFKFLMQRELLPGGSRRWAGAGGVETAESTSTSCSSSTAAPSHPQRGNIQMIFAKLDCIERSGYCAYPIRSSLFAHTACMLVVGVILYVPKQG
jgi:hypothetical protein